MVTAIPGSFTTLLIAAIFSGKKRVPCILADALRLSGVTASHQNTPLEIEVGKRTENLKARPVLRQAPIADMGKAKNPLDHQKGMLAFRALFI